MASRTLRAHFDGQNIQIDEPCDLKPDDKLLVIVLDDDSEPESERENWARFSLTSMARAYGDDEPEYSLDSITEPNSEYDGR
jgi:hypothetical protein